ncbi:hypothetical protein K443DRAFT_457341 [Laccaria amethystina LaAM-08-1]|uniref:Uncharacterized protein n=1 Tax=Laccaria amethystina LaAM-08-1 TaxID=1095629 RepID=A0A0C9XG64_9AGAR|nr:hypothetical protein K443DRAFT_457341 [Laccaria amethystina LaAM-08-1]
MPNTILHSSALVLCATSISLFISPFARDRLDRVSFRHPHIHVSTTASVLFNIVPLDCSTLASCFVIVHIQFLVLLILVSNHCHQRCN